MKKYFLFVTLALFFSFVSANSMTAYTTGDDAFIQLSGSTESAAQIFQVSTNNTLTEVSMKIYRAGNPEIARVALYSTNSTGGLSGSGVAVLANLSYNFSTITTDTAGEWVSFNLTDTPITANTLYALVLENSTSADGSNNIKWRYDSTGTYDQGYQIDDYTILQTARDNMFIINNTAQNVYNLTTYQTSQETFSTNITISATSTLSSVNFIYNGSSSTATVTDLGGQNRTFSATIDIPSDAQTSSDFYWRMNYANGSVIDTESSSQEVSIINLTLCGAAPQNVSFLNFSFQDELNLTVLSAAIPSITADYYLGSGTSNKTFSFVNTTENQNYSFCFTPRTEQVVVDYRIQYESSGYPQRVTDPIPTTFTNTTANRVLYLLNLNDGIYTTFQVVNIAEQVLSNVLVNASRTISGSTTVLEEGITSGTGSVTFFLDPDFIYDFAFLRSDYPLFTTSFAPTLTEYTITLGSQTTTQEQDLSRGMSYVIEPLALSLFNDTVYEFNFTLNSSYWDLQEFGFILKNSTGDVLGSDSSSTNLATVKVNANTTNNTLISMEYYWVVNNTYFNLTKNWYVLSSGGTDWSIANFFTDLNSYVDSGLFGMTDLGLTIILFFTMILLVGTASIKFGIQSQETLLALVFGLVLLFDVGLGMLDNINPVSAIPNFATIFVGLIVFAVLASRWR